MSTAYRFTQRARLDVLQIWNHIAEDSVDAADRVALRIRAACERLAEFPDIGHRRPELGDAYRVWQVYSYLIVYRPDFQPLTVIRVVSGYRDLARLFQ